MNCKSCLIFGSKQPSLRHCSCSPFPSLLVSLCSMKLYLFLLQEVGDRAKNVLARNKMGIEPNHSTAKKFLARNEMGMEPDHMTAKKFLAINEVGMEPNHITAEKFLARNKVGMEPNHMTAKKVLAINEVGTWSRII
jgi:hypothetical protein